jgi:hypothetical protein
MLGSLRSNSEEIVIVLRRKAYTGCKTGENNSITYRLKADRNQM